MIQPLQPDVRRAIPAGACESRWVTADGWEIRRIDWQGGAGDATGSILFLPGRGDFYEKYLETLDHWNRLGWRVTAADWRGQGASGRLGHPYRTGHVSDFSIWIDDLAELWQLWQRETPGPHFLIGHSMGGHLVLRALAEGRVSPNGVILSVPMLGFAGSLLPQALLHLATRTVAALGDRRRPAWKNSEAPGHRVTARDTLLTHDPERYADESYWLQIRPELRVGPGSWGWVERAFASMHGLFAPGLLEAITTPVLILATDHDRLVSYQAIARAAARLGDCQLVRFGSEARHEILREVDRVRALALAACDGFMARIAARRTR